MSYLFDHFDSIRKHLLLSPFGFFTDVDGTISKIAESPDEARVSSICRESLEKLANHLTVVGAISGRPVTDVREMVGVEDMVYIGNHGLERWVDGEVRYVEGVEEYMPRIEAVLNELKGLITIEGVVLENKGPIASIHYRQCRDQEAAQKVIVEIAHELAKHNNLKVGLGKMVVELKPPMEVDKGIAICNLAEEYKLKGAIYLGDDLTDVDVFKAFKRQGLHFTGISVGVVSDETSTLIAEEADYIVNGVEEVERFLTQVVADVVE